MKVDQAYIENILSLYGKGKFNDIIQLANTTLETTKHPVVYNLLGASYIATNDLSNAKDTYELLTEQFPDYVDGFINLGTVYHKSKLYEDAKLMFDKSLAFETISDDSKHNVYNNLGVLLIDMNKNEEAIEILKKAIILNDRTPESYNNIGNAYRNIKKYKESLVYFEKAIERFPENQQNLEGYKEIMHALENSYRNVGDHKKGLEYEKEGPGLVSFSIKEDILHPNSNEIDIDNKKSPHFIGMWNINNDQLCDNVIDFFNESPKKHQGKTGAAVNEDIKKSIDVTIRPSDFNLPNFIIFKEFSDLLHSHFKLYCDKWDILNELNLSLGSFNIQKYDTDGHFQKLHSERMDIGSMHRVFAWMIYLNNVEDGGNTTFPYFDLTIKPEKGKLLIWPAEWTHTHCGEKVHSDVKYIMTGWIDMVD